MILDQDISSILAPETVFVGMEFFLVDLAYLGKHMRLIIGMYMIEPEAGIFNELFRFITEELFDCIADECCTVITPSLCRIHGSRG